MIPVIRCPKCNGNLVMQNFELICENCGLVVETHPVDYASYQGITVRGRPYFSRRTELGYDLIKKAGELLNLPSPIVNYAKYLYDTYSRKGKNGFTSYIYISAAALIISGRKYNYLNPVTIKSIVDVYFRLNHKLYFKTLIRNLERMRRLLRITNDFNRAEDYVNKILIKLKEKNKWIKDFTDINEIEREAIELLRNLKKTDRFGKNPYTLAATAVYQASFSILREKHFRLKDIANVAGVHVTTIRDYVRIFRSKCIRK